MKRLLVGLAVLAALAAAPAASPSPAEGQRVERTVTFRSPSGNIRCQYRDQVGVGCMTLNNGLGVFLRSFDDAYYLDARYDFYPPAGFVLAYGRTLALSTFRCHVNVYRMKCWSLVTGHGFTISRTSRYAF